MSPLLCSPTVPWYHITFCGFRGLTFVPSIAVLFALHVGPFLTSALFPDGGLSDGAIAGIVIGVLVAVALVAVLAFFLVR
jgi:hypothetical protein